MINKICLGRRSSRQGHLNLDYLFSGSLEGLRFHSNVSRQTINWHNFLPFCRLQHELGLSVDYIPELADVETEFL